MTQFHWSRGIAMSMALSCVAAGQQATNARVVIPFPDPRLVISGLPWLEENGGRLSRLPARLKDSFRTPVWSLAQSTSGVRIRFSTNSSSIKIVAQSGTGRAHHMTSIMQNGLDIYVDGFYKASAWPDGKGRIDRSVGGLGAKSEFRTITVHLPLYGSASIQEITLAPGAEVKPPSPFAFPAPIVYYGSSITQGGCASNPGLSYQAILGRRLNADFVNLGFSGNGLGEPEVAKAVAEIDAVAFVLDYWANPAAAVFERTLPGFVDIIRTAHPTVPIIVTTPFYNPFRERIQAQKREIAEVFVSKRRAAGDTNIHCVEGREMISKDTAWGLVDGRHANSLGFYLCANGLEPHLRRVLGVPAAATGKEE
ncbi:MAG: hypothetical protein HN742_03510 [Lentisphaerae bacterium]|nr:hypothetical protein [Lentisphaerota bacterium]MBT4821212.1 hypothetical protein [Lentisphaerota bacterium]MBT5609676.1 hypothetical protein [Lentisphaerota bacterium]MBT7054800.1 hypothetical protein [Lentisphaerota bacterium]MBT7840909.1 hypothetical protein [Lentisphaerota bacterium]